MSAFRGFLPFSAPDIATLHRLLRSISAGTRWYTPMNAAPEHYLCEIV